MDIPSQMNISPSGKFEFIIETTNEFIKGKLYSVKTRELCGKVKYSGTLIPFCFFVKNNKEYLITGTSHNNCSLIQCQTGHVVNTTFMISQENFSWSKIKQIDDQTFFVLGQIQGVSPVYRFYDFSDLQSFCNPLEIFHDNLKFDFHFQEIDLPEPILQENKIIFSKTQTRINGLGKRKTDFDIKDIDLTLEEYEKQEQKEDGYVIFMSEEKEYEIDILRIKMIRVENYLEIIEFWIEEKYQIDIIREQKQKELEMNSIRYQKIKSNIDNLTQFRKVQYNSIESGQKYCHIHFFPMDVKSYHYHLFFPYQDENIPYQIEFNNLRKFNQYNNSLTFWNEDLIYDLIS
jgi:hypothetical protein